MKPQLSLMDGWKNKHVQKWVFVVVYTVEEKNSLLVGLQEGLAAEFKFGRLHLRASLLCEKGKTRGKRNHSDT